MDKLDLFCPTPFHFRIVPCFGQRFFLTGYFVQTWLFFKSALQCAGMSQQRFLWLNSTCFGALFPCLKGSSLWEILGISEVTKLNVFDADIREAFVQAVAFSHIVG